MAPPRRPMDPPLPAVAKGRVSGDRWIERMATYAIHAALELGVLNALAHGPDHAETLAHRLAVDADALFRLMRVLVSLDVVSEHDGDFSLGPMAAYASDGSIGDPDPSNPLEAGWAALADAVRCGVPAFEAVHGLPLFEYLDQNPDLAKRFQARMRDRGEDRDMNVAETFDFTRFQTIVDVGGGTGGLLTCVLRSSPSARGVLFDQPTVIDVASQELDSEVCERMMLVAGDMFRSVPAGGNAYLLASILHDWDDESAVRLLQTVRGRMASDATLLIVELVLPDHLRDTRRNFLDLEMLALTGGRERTMSAYASLLEAAGLAVDETIETASLYTVICAHRWP
jgi:hypothetical protein